jgi:phosphatidylinositol 4-kinase
LIETVPNAISIHSIKKKILLDLDRSEFTPEDLSLKGYFIRKFGTPDSKSFLDAVDSFINSLAGYSLLTYTLQIRDRHNGNILLDKDGNLIVEGYFPSVFDHFLSSYSEMLEYLRTHTGSAN